MSQSRTFRIAPGGRFGAALLGLLLSSTLVHAGFQVRLDNLAPGLTGTVTYDIGAGSVTRSGLGIGQLNATVDPNQLLGPSFTFKTFSIDLHGTNHGFGQTYSVAERNIATFVPTTFSSRIAHLSMSYLYGTYGDGSVALSDNEGAALQLALWKLSLGPAMISFTSNLLDGSSDPSSVQQRYNFYLSDAAAHPTFYAGSWLDRGSGSGQHLLYNHEDGRPNLTAPAPGTAVLASAGAIIVGLTNLVSRSRMLWERQRKTTNPSTD